MGIHKKFHEKNRKITLYFLFFLFQDKPPINIIKFYLTWKINQVIYQPNPD
jgi:hypothetical protein